MLRRTHALAALFGVLTLSVLAAHPTPAAADQGFRGASFVERADWQRGYRGHPSDRWDRHDRGRHYGWERGRHRGWDRPYRRCATRYERAYDPFTGWTVQPVRRCW
jgi:hypothetical protein